MNPAVIRSVQATVISEDKPKYRIDESIDPSTGQIMWTKVREGEEKAQMIGHARALDELYYKNKKLELELKRERAVAAAGFGKPIVRLGCQLEKQPMTAADKIERFTHESLISSGIFFACLYVIAHLTGHWPDWSAACTALALGMGYFNGAVRHWTRQTENVWKDKKNPYVGERDPW